MDGDLEVLAAVVGHLAATRSIAGEGVIADHAGAVGGAADINGVVAATGTAALGSGVGADEGAGVARAVETAGALCALGSEFDALHVNLAGDVEAAVSTSTEGELEDGLVEQAHEEIGVAEGGTASTREAVSSGELLGLAGTELDRDDGLVGVDPHGGLAPAVDGGVLVGRVCEGGRVLAAVTNPHLTVVGLSVHAELGSESRDESIDAVEEASCEAAGGRRGLAGLGRGSLLGGRWGSSRCRGNGLSGSSGDNFGLRRGGCGSSRGRGGFRGGSVAVVDLAPVDSAEVVGDLCPVDVLGVALDVAGRSVSTSWTWVREQSSYSLSLVESSVTESRRGGGLADGEGAQHHSGLVTHFEGGYEAG